MHSKEGAASLYCAGTAPGIAAANFIEHANLAVHYRAPARLRRERLRHLWEPFCDIGPGASA